VLIGLLNLLCAGYGYTLKILKLSFSSRVLLMLTKGSFIAILLLQHVNSFKLISQYNSRLVPPSKAQDNHTFWKNWRAHNSREICMSRCDDEETMFRLEERIRSNSIIQACKAEASRAEMRELMASLIEEGEARRAKMRQEAEARRAKMEEESEASRAEMRQLMAGFNTTYTAGIQERKQQLSNLQDTYKYLDLKLTLLALVIFAFSAAGELFFGKLLDLLKQTP
jgi:hypothetical protein